MAIDSVEHQRRANFTRYQPGQVKGHYESFFMRANHPTRPLAFWIRYTIFSPHREPSRAIGELWAMYFDGEKRQHLAVKEEYPLDQCAFSRSGFDVRVGEAKLTTQSLVGRAAKGGRTIEWDLQYAGGQEPLFLLPLNFYNKGFPKAKALVAAPMCSYSGSLTVDGVRLEIERWIGSQNHNWGSKHTDYYAWGQVCGFDQEPDTFLEVATAKLKLGPIWTPFMTPVVVRRAGEEYAANALWRTLWRGRFEPFQWQFKTNVRGCQITGRIWANPHDFVALTYYNPPGGTKTCLNSKIASAELHLSLPSGQQVTLSTAHRAAFEILTDSRDHGVSYQT